MNGCLMWSLVLPLLLVIAGIVTIRRRNRRPCPGPAGASDPRPSGGSSSRTTASGGGVRNGPHARVRLNAPPSTRRRKEPSGTTPRYRCRRLTRTSHGVATTFMDSNLEDVPVDIGRTKGRGGLLRRRPLPDRKSTRLNSSHANISYAV